MHVLGLEMVIARRRDIVLRRVQARLDNEEVRLSRADLVD